MTEILDETTAEETIFTMEAHDPETDAVLATAHSPEELQEILDRTGHTGEWELVAPITEREIAYVLEIAQHERAGMLLHVLNDVEAIQ